MSNKVLVKLFFLIHFFCIAELLSSEELVEVGVTDLSGSPCNCILWINDEPIAFIKKSPTLPSYFGGYPVKAGSNTLRITKLSKCNYEELDLKKYYLYYSSKGETNEVTEKYNDPDGNLCGDFALGYSTNKQFQDGISKLSMDPEEVLTEFTSTFLKLIGENNMEEVLNLFSETSRIHQDELEEALATYSTLNKNYSPTLNLEKPKLQVIRGRNILMVCRKQQNSDNGSHLISWTGEGFNAGITFLLYRVDEQGNVFMKTRYKHWYALNMKLQ